MTEPNATAVDELLNRLVLEHDDALQDALADSAAAGLPAIEVSPQAAQLLGLLVRMAGARRILEIGTLGGYSTICLARAAGPESSVVTLEYEPRHAEVAAANLRRAGVGDRVEIIVGAALDTLPTLTGRFDFVFIDADKPGYLDYVEFLIDSALLSPRAVIAVDNTLLQGEPYSGTVGMSANGAAIAKFNAALTYDSRVEQVVLPLRDGVTLIRRTPDTPR